MITLTAVMRLRTACSDAEPAGPATNEPATVEITTPEDDSGTDNPEYD